MSKGRILMAALLTAILRLLAHRGQRRVARQAARLILAGEGRALSQQLAGRPRGPAGFMPEHGRLDRRTWRAMVRQLPIVNPPEPRQPTLQALALLAGRDECFRILMRQDLHLDPARGDRLVIAAALQMHGEARLRALSRTTWSTP